MGGRSRAKKGYSCYQEGEDGSARHMLPTEAKEREKRRVRGQKGRERGGAGLGDPGR